MSTPNQTKTPDQLIRMFSQGRFLFGIVMAVVLHIIFVLVTSVGYLRDRVDPEGAAARKQSAAAEATPEAPAASPTPAIVAPPEATQAPAAVAPPAPSAAPSAEPSSEEALLQERAGSALIQSITETATPDELPKEPGDEGLSLDVTKPIR